MALTLAAIPTLATEVENIEGRMDALNTVTEAAAEKRINAVARPDDACLFTKEKSRLDALEQKARSALEEVIDL